MIDQKSPLNQPAAEELKLLAASREESSIPAREKDNALTPPQVAWNARPVFDFLRVGKELPYKVPEGFFDAMPERTLQKAKVRLEKRKRRVLFTSGFAVFAAAAAILAFVFLLPNRALKQENQLVAVVEPLETTLETPVKSAKLNSKRTFEKIVSAKAPAEVSKEENLEDILKNLSEEDLSELLAEYKADDLEEIASTETTNIN